MKWNAGKENSFYSNNKNEPPPFLGQSSVNISGETPFDYFTFFFTEDLMNTIVYQTNKYAIEKGKDSLKLTNKELKVFLGINLAMTYIHYPRLRMYWSSVSSLRCSFIADAMTVNRFEEIRRYLHFVDNNQPQEERSKDRFWKLKTVIDSLHETFHKGQDPEEHMAIDEMMVPFKGHHGAKQYIRSKPKKWGFKMWVRASQKGYVQCFELYGGKKHIKTNLSPISETVLRLCHDIHHKNHKLFMDNLFVSIPLIKKLREDGIFALGTVRLNRVPGVDNELVPVKNLRRGMTSIATSEDNISVLRWMDNRQVHMASTYAGALPEDTVKRYDRTSKTIVEIPRPYAIREYNRYMGGVDMADRMIAHYPHGLKSKRWYLRIFFHLINVCVINAWLCYKRSLNERIDLLTFKSSVANSFIQLGVDDSKKRGRPSSLSPGNEHSKKKKVAKVNVLPELRFDGINHWPTKNVNTREHCCRLPTCKRRTRYMCRKCGIHVCPDCMELFHSK